MQLEPELVPSTLTAQIWKDRASVGERLAEIMNGLEVGQMNKYVEASFYPLAKKPNKVSQINTRRCFSIYPGQYSLAARSLLKIILLPTPPYRTAAFCLRSSFVRGLLNSPGSAPETHYNPSQ